MDAFFHSVIAARIIFIFAILNIMLGILVFFTCRCLPGASFTHHLLKNANYMKLYRFHGYLWLMFLCSVIIHAVFAIAFMGIPF